MISKTFVGIAKFATFIGIPGAGTFTSIAKLGTQVLPYVQKLLDAGIDSLNEMAEFKKLMKDRDVLEMIRKADGKMINS
jgi:hypothetical protein